jgi:hypothetical protein
MTTSPQSTGARSLAALILAVSLLAGCGGGNSTDAVPADTSKSASGPAGG